MWLRNSAAMSLKKRAWKPHFESISEELTECQAKIKLVTDPAQMVDNTIIYSIWLVITFTPYGDITFYIDVLFVLLNVSLPLAFVNIQLICGYQITDIFQLLSLSPELKNALTSDHWHHLDPTDSCPNQNCAWKILCVLWTQTLSQKLKIMHW